MSNKISNAALIQRRINSVLINKPEGWESTAAYLATAQADVLGSMNEAGLAEYTASQNVTKTQAQMDADMAQQMRDMQFNRDSPSI